MLTAPVARSGVDMMAEVGRVAGSAKEGRGSGALSVGLWAMEFNLHVRTTHATSPKRDMNHVGNH